MCASKVRREKMKKFKDEDVRKLHEQNQKPVCFKDYIGCQVCIVLRDFLTEKQINEFENFHIYEPEQELLQLNYPWIVENLENNLEFKFVETSRYGDLVYESEKSVIVIHQLYKGIIKDTVFGQYEYLLTPVVDENATILMPLAETRLGGYYNNKPILTEKKYEQKDT